MSAAVLAMAMITTALYILQQERMRIARQTPTKNIHEGEARDR